MVAHFTADQVETLRRHAHATWLAECESRDLDAHPNGWQLSPADPMELLAVFTELKLQAGYELQAYINYWSRSLNSLGVVWAVPAGNPQPAPEDCEWAKTARHKSAPKPPSAIDNVMDVIDGTRTPWSYVSACLLDRELRDFGATWHGVWWGHQIVVDDDPWSDAALARRLVIWPEGGLRTAPDQVAWPTGRPVDWRVTYRDDTHEPLVEFLTFSDFEIERIRRHNDTFAPASYRFDTIVEDIARGGSGFIV